MQDEKTYSILFIINNETGGIKPLLPKICKVLTKQCHDIHVLYPKNINEEFETSLREVPWIHAYPLVLSENFSPTQAAIPLEIRNYIARHDGIDIIHSFGLNQGMMGYFGAINLKTKIINTPDPIDENEKDKNFVKIFQQLLVDNATYILNRLYDRILFTSEEDQKKASKHISYRNIKTEFLNINGTPSEISERLIEVYGKIINETNT